MSTGLSVRKKEKKGERTSTYDITLKEPGVVVNVPPYRIPHKYQAVLREELKNLETSGIIEKSLSTFNALVLCIRKK